MKTILALSAVMALLSGTVSYADQSLKNPSAADSWAIDPVEAKQDYAVKNCSLLSVVSDFPKCIEGDIRPNRQHGNYESMCCIAVSHVEFRQLPHNCKRHRF